jgi:hypothetical protein
VVRSQRAVSNRWVSPPTQSMAYGSNPTGLSIRSTPPVACVCHWEESGDPASRVRWPEGVRGRVDAFGSAA